MFAPHYYSLYYKYICISKSPIHLNGFLEFPEITLTNPLHDKQVYFQVVLVSPLIDGCTCSFCRKKGENMNHFVGNINDLSISQYCIKPIKTSLDMDEYQNRNSVINITDRLNAGSQPFSLQQWKLAPSRYSSVHIIHGIHVCVELGICFSMEWWHQSGSRLVGT